MSAGTAEMAKKQTEIELLGQKINDQLDRMEKNSVRLTAIGNKLIDESGMPKEGQPPQPSPYSPGIISGFNSLLDRLSELNRQHDAQISKLEDLI